MGGFVPKPIRPKPQSNRLEDQPEVIEARANQPKVSSQMNAPKPIGTPAGPTDIEMDQDDNLRTKRKGRKNTILTSSQGLGENIELGKKTLLG